MRKGILLAGGSATRLRPLTEVISKHLLAVYDKPLIYYPLTTLMLSGIRDILLITNPNQLDIFKNFLGDGTKWGISIQYKSQSNPDGVAQSMILAKDYLAGEPSALVLGDNLFHGTGLGRRLSGIEPSAGAIITAYQVSEPSAFGVVEFNSEGKVLTLEEKPMKPRSNWVVPGLYFYDSTASERAMELKPSQRGELEITDLNLSYQRTDSLFVHKLSRGTTWLDMGTADSLLDAAEYVRMIQNRQGMLVGSPEEVAWRQGWITDRQVAALSESYRSNYGQALRRLITEGEAKN